MVSVVIPTYNREKLIKRAVQSIINQTYTDLEIIVVDDASTDKTKEVIESIKCDHLRYLKMKKNGGACKARNAGIHAANGEYIAFLDSDDIWEPTKIEEQMEFLKINSASVVACNYWYEKAGKKSVKVNLEHASEFKLNELLNENYITTGALLISKQLILEVGCFDEKMPRYQDWELAIRIAKSSKIYFLNKPLLTLFFQETSITNSTSKEKKYIALSRMYEKNKDDYLSDKRAYAHICWSMGMYSLYSENIRYDFLKNGVYADGFNIRRFLIYAAVRIGFKDVVKGKYGVNH